MSARKVPTLQVDLMNSKSDKVLANITAIPDSGAQATVAENIRHRGEYLLIAANGLSLE